MKKILIAALASAILVGCGREAKFKVEGNVAGGAGKSLVLSKADFVGRWIDVDSVRIADDGSFSIASISPASPEIYRLSLDGNYIYLPVDSVETLVLETAAADYGRKFTLSGSPNATKIADFDMLAQNLNMADSAALDKFKKEVYTSYIQNSQGSIVSYYVLTKFIGDKPLFDPENPVDAKYYAAVATQYEQFNPGDPHGKMVKEASLRAMRKHNTAQGKRRVLQASELKVIDINLPDENGKNVKLSDIVGKGKPVAVIFGMMNAKESPAFNRELAAIHTRLGGKALFYHVSLDADTYAWRDAARNLPWTTVLDVNGTTSTALVDYNVGALPAFFIYNAAGDLVDRADTLADFEKKISAQ